MSIPAPSFELVSPNQLRCMILNYHEDHFKILIASNTTIYRDSLRKIIEAIPKKIRISEATDSNELVRLAKQSSWDVLLIEAQEIDILPIFPFLRNGHVPRFIALGLKASPEPIR